MQDEWAADANKIAQYNQAHVWIPEEHKFMVIGGRTSDALDTISSHAILYSPYFPDEIERL